jgi:hypothetical protein
MKEKWNGTLLNDGQKRKGCREGCTADDEVVACTNKAASKRHLCKITTTLQ